MAHTKSVSSHRDHSSKVLICFPAAVHFGTLWHTCTPHGYPTDISHASCMPLTRPLRKGPDASSAHIIQRLAQRYCCWCQQCAQSAHSCSAAIYTTVVSEEMPARHLHMHDFWVQPSRPGARGGPEQALHPSSVLCLTVAGSTLGTVQQQHYYAEPELGASSSAILRLRITKGSLSPWPTLTG